MTKTRKKDRLTLEKLILKGYFPEELPPVFTTKEFSKKLDILSGFSTSHNSEPAIFSIPKKINGRRKIMIPNPSHYLNISKIIIKNQEEILKISQSKNSSSEPVINNSDEERRAFGTKENYAQFLWKCFELSHGMSYEIVTDISRFYPTIYTHTIPWVMHGKFEAKKDQMSEKLIGSKIDKAMRTMQSNQTIGVPTGPDISNIIAEMICSTIDKSIIKIYPKLRFRRYRDDFRFYTETKVEAEEILRFFDSILDEFLLEKNEEKTNIKNEIPLTIEAEWVPNIRQFIIRDGIKEEKEDLTSLYSLVLRYSRQFPNAGVIKYSFIKFASKTVNRENIRLLITLLFRLIEDNTSNMKELATILIQYKGKIPKNTLKKEIDVLLKKHIMKENSFETLWLLWISKVFEIKIKKSYANKIISGKDSLSIILILDLKNSKLVSKNISTKKLSKNLTSVDFGTEWWLLKHEAGLKKWLKLGEIKNDGFFKKLKSEKISFYDTNAITIKNNDKIKSSLKGLIMSFGGSSFY